MTDEGFVNLSHAIILQAVKDFRAAYAHLKRHPDNKGAESMVKETTQFFCSDYFSMLTDLDGPTLVKKLMKEIDNKSKGGDAE